MNPNVTPTSATVCRTPAARLPLLTALSLALATCLASTLAAAFTPVGPPIAQGKSLFLGCAYSSGQAPNFAAYFNQVTPENGGKWGSVERTRDVMSWGEMDAAYDYAKANGLLVRFHILVWGSQQPSWISALSTAEKREELEEWFAAVAARYPDLDYVEVVNEPLHAPPNGEVIAFSTTRAANYSDALGGAGASGWEWLVESFRLARRYFPGKDLVLNEYGLLNDGGMTARYVQIVNLLKAENLVDVISTQAHAFETAGVSANTIAANLATLAGTGLPIMITEMDVDGPNDQVQLGEYMRIFPILWNHPSVIGITLWGYRPGLWRDAQGANLVLADNTERPAMLWLRAYAGTPNVTTQPFNYAATSGGSASFTVAVSSAFNVTYQWQVSTNNGDTWTALANGGSYSAVDGATLGLAAITPAMNGYRYRCVVNNGVGLPVVSAAASLSVGFSTPPVITTATPRTLGVVAGQAGAIGVIVDGASAYQWYRGGLPLSGATGAVLSWPSVGPAEAGIYEAFLSGPGGETLSYPMVVGVVPVAGQRTAGAVVTRAEWTDIHHPNGAVYDQFLLTGAAGTFTADPEQIARMSYLDEDNSIVQVEMSGAGAITVVLDNPSGPMAPALYNQSGIQYMKGKATIILSGADATTHFTIYSVGTATNPGVTRPEVIYAGWANVAAAGIISANGGLGGIHQGNANYNATVGLTGIYAPTVTTIGSLAVVHGVTASGAAAPYLYFGPGGTVKVKIAGSALAQPNSASIAVSGLAEVQMGAGQDSCGRAAAAQAIQSELTNDAGVNVTSSLVVNP